MVAFIFRRILFMVPTLFGVSLLAFFLIRLVPGDPVLLMLGERGSDPAAYEAMKANLGLDKSLSTQYWNFITKAIQGNLGESIVSKRPVMEEFLARFPATVELGLSAVIFAIFLGIPFGIIAAVRRNTFFDYWLMGISLVGFSMPVFWWGLLLILLFSVTFGFTPVSGRISALYDVQSITGFYIFDTLWAEAGAWKSALMHLILPMTALGTIPLAVITRMTRSSMLEVLSEDYIRTARAKGLNKFQVIYIHGLRNALIPILTVIGLLLGTVLTGAILTETIFSWPGIGKWIVQSVNARDYPVVQGGILCIAIVIIFVNLLVDLLYAWANPKLRALS